jgi:hypothetical protein
MTIPLVTAASTSQTKGAMVPIAYLSWTGPGTTDAFYFNNIPQTYQDLMITWHVRSNNNATTLSDAFLRLNNDTDASLRYSSTWVDFNGSAGTGNSTRETNAQFGMISGLLTAGDSVNSSIQALNQIYIFDYTSTSKFKTVLTKSSLNLNGSGKSRLGVGLYRNTAAVGALNVYSSGSFPSNYLTNPGATCALWGIRRANQ